MGYYHLTSENRKARKPHRCIWCGQAIIVGEQYIHIRGVMDGDMQTDAWHPECRTGAADECGTSGDWEFTAFDNERPAKQSPSEGEKHE